MGTIFNDAENLFQAIIYLQIITECLYLEFLKSRHILKLSLGDSINTSTKIST